MQLQLIGKTQQQCSETARHDLPQLMSAERHSRLYLSLDCREYDGWVFFELSGLCEAAYKHEANCASVPSCRYVFSQAGYPSIDRCRADPNCSSVYSRDAQHFRLEADVIVPQIPQSLNAKANQAHK